MNHLFIVAIGASSGGLEEINSFFDHSIKLDASYIISHHFSRENTSTLVELLSRHSKVSVRDATDQMRIVPNTVYILPAHHQVIVKDYHFRFEPPKIKEPGKFSIDHFFISLASCCKSKAIGIILSGTGTDGIAGLKAIKNEGGTVIVRNPKTTNFSEMPTIAIESGVADFILEPEFMPVTVEQIISEAGLTLAKNTNR